MYNDPWLRGLSSDRFRSCGLLSGSWLCDSDLLAGGRAIDGSGLIAKGAVDGAGPSLHDEDDEAGEKKVDAESRGHAQLRSFGWRPIY